MATYVTPKRATEFIFYVSLVSQSNTKIFQANPTLAAGDVKVSIDGGAEANLATLPAVTPAGSRRVKVTVSIAEMTGDNIQITFCDAAGSEWCDLTCNIQTTARQVDDLAQESSITTLAANSATALLDASNGIETGVTPRQCMRAMAAVLAGLITGAGTGTEVYKGLGHAAAGTTRVTVTVDQSGNRSVTTLNL